MFEHVNVEFRNRVHLQTLHNGLYKNDRVP